MTSVTVSDIVKRAGFAENAAESAKIEKLLSGATHKTLDVARMVTSACGTSQSSATVKEDHLKLLARLTPVLSTSAGGSSSGGGSRRSGSMSGGAIRMPSEYYGIDSGNYYADVPYGHAPWSDPNLTRTPLTASGSFRGGGAAGKKEAKFDDSMLSKLVKEYNDAKKDRVRIAEGARPLLKKIVLTSVTEALRAQLPAAAGKKRLTGSMVDKARQNLRVKFTSA